MAKSTIKAPQQAALRLRGGCFSYRRPSLRHCAEQIRRLLSIPGRLQLSVDAAASRLSEPYCNVTLRQPAKALLQDEAVGK